MAGNGARTHDLRGGDNVVERKITVVLDCMDEYMDGVAVLFFSFLRSRAGSLSARIRRAAAEGTTDTVALRF
jgi:hypothetical protein